MAPRLSEITLPLSIKDLRLVADWPYLVQMYSKTRAGKITTKWYVLYPRMQSFGWVLFGWEGTSWQVNDPQHEFAGIAKIFRIYGK